jgi:hypothetical protein
MRRRPCPRPGLTRADLAVASVLLALVAALLIPSCARVGGAAARTQCQNNLKIILLAVHNYASTYNMAMPSLASAPTGGRWANGRGDTYPQSFFFTLLPFIEQDAMYKAGMQPSTNGLTWNGRGLAGNIYSHGFVRWYVCPADPTNSPERPTAVGWCGCSYGPNYQVFGTKDWGPKYSIGAIPDGTANTVGAAERFAQFPGSPGQFTDPAGATQQANSLWAWPANFPPSPPASYTKPVPQYAALFAHGDPGDESVGYGKAVFGPPQAGIRPNDADYRLAQSGHTKVVQVGMMDGSARSINGTISQATWQNALTPADGNTLGSDW